MATRRFRLRLHHDHLTEGAAGSLDAERRVVYCVDGDATLLAGAERTAIGEDEAWFGAGGLSLSAGAEGARLWRWELVAPGAPDETFQGVGIKSVSAGDYDLELDDSAEWLMRCDRVSFPAGGEALTHVHAAPGVRCQLTGSLLVESQGRRVRAWPGDSWVEHGPDEVYAKASSRSPSSFVRVMIVPVAYRGRPTITYVRPEDASKPKSQTYKRYLEHAIAL